MDLRYFFAGSAGKELTASAWLATMLRFDPGFRAAFFAASDVTPPLVADAEWEVDVETPLDGYCDVTMRAPDTLVLIENKVSLSARRPEQDQLATYYRAAVREHGANRIVAIFVGPTVAAGIDEVATVEAAPEFIARRTAGSADAVGRLGWKEEVPRCVAARTGPDVEFAESGLRGILAHMARLDAGLVENPERLALRAIVAEVRVALTRAFAGRAAIGSWASVGQHSLYTVAAPVTTFVTLDYEEDPDPPNAIVDVFHGDRITLSIGMSLGLSGSGRKNPALVDAWGDLLGRGPLPVPGLDTGTLPPASRKRFVASVPFEGTRDDLVRLLVARGTALIEAAIAIGSR